MLIMLPLLRRLAMAMEKRDYCYAAVCGVIFVGVIPMLEYVLSGGSVTMTSHFSVRLFTTPNIFYVFMGYFFEHLLEEKYYTLKNVVMALCAGALAIVLTCAVTQYGIRLTGNAALQTFAIYFSAKYLFKRFRPAVPIQKIICTLGGTTFGVFLLEQVLRDQLIYVFRAVCPLIHVFPATLVYIVTAVLVGCGITWVLKHVPVIRNFL